MVARRTPVAVDSRRTATSAREEPATARAGSGCTWRSVGGFGGGRIRDARGFLFLYFLFILRVAGFGCGERA